MIYKTRYKLSNCPICNKEEGACTVDSTWGHQISCCSDECGLIMKDKLDELYDSPDMQKLLNAKRKIQEQIEAKLKEVTKTHIEPFFMAWA